MICVCDAEHLVVFREVKSPQWNIAMLFYKTSGAVARPVKLTKCSTTMQLLFVEFDEVPSIGQTYWRHRPYVFASWASWDFYWAYSCEWHSWAWQCNTVPSCQSKFQLVVRLLAKGVEKSFIEVAAEAAFGELSATELKLIARVQKYTLDDSACCFEVLLTMRTQALKLKDDQKVLDILKKRLATLQPTDQSVY